MGRPSVVDTRREEILDALAECVLEYGLAATTLAQVAERAGIAPSAINHFVGNRAQVVEAALARSTAYYEELIDSLSEETLPQVLDALIGDESVRRTVDPTAIVLFDEMLTLAPRDPQVHQRINHVLGSLRRLIERCLNADYPNATAANRRSVALAIMLLIDNLERHVVLNTIPASDRRDARRAIDALVATLDQ